MAKSPTKPKKAAPGAHKAAGAKPSQMAVVRAAASELLSRAQLASAAGLTFGNKRDLYKALGYTRTLQPRDYRDRFDRDPIANRVVTAYPKATWRAGADLVEDEDPDTLTPFEDAFGAFAKRLRLWRVFSRTDQLAGLSRYAVLLIGAPGDLKQELPKGSSLDEIAFLQPFAEDDAPIAEWDVDPASPRYGMPTAYDLRRVRADVSGRAGGNVAAGQQQRVHWSRVIHVPEGALDDEIYGTPRLRAIWNRLDDLEKVVGGGAEAFWLRAHPGYQLDLDPEVEMGEGEEDALNDEIDEFEHGLRRFVRTRGLKMNALDASVAEISRPADAILSLIAAGTGIPKRILLGSERGELASSQDKNNFDQRVADRRGEFAEPMVIEAFMDRLMAYGYCEQVDYKIVWPAEQDLSDTEKGALAKTYAEVNAAAGDIVVTPDEMREVLGKGPLADAVDEEELEAMRARMKPAAPAMPGDDPEADADTGDGAGGADDEGDNAESETASAGRAARVAAGARRGGRRARAAAAGAARVGAGNA